MAELIAFPTQPITRERRLLDPVAAEIVAQSNLKQSVVSAGPRRFVAGRRAALDECNREVAASDARLRALHAEAVLLGATRIHVPPIPEWLFWCLLIVGVISEFVLGLNALDYAYLQGRSLGAPGLLEHFQDVGFFAGLLSAVADYATQESLAALGLAVSAMAGGKATGTWIRQRASGRSGVPGWLLIAYNTVFLATCLGFLFLRHAALEAQPDAAAVASLTPAFFGIQLLFYCTSVFLAAWCAPPDPEAERLATLEKRESARLRKFIRQRARISAAVTSALAGALAESERVARQSVADLQAYRTANLAARGPDVPVPACLREPIGAEVFAPLWIDPQPDTPPATLEDILRLPESGTNLAANARQGA